MSYRRSAIYPNQYFKLNALIYDLSVLQSSQDPMPSSLTHTHVLDFYVKIISSKKHFFRGYTSVSNTSFQADDVKS